MASCAWLLWLLRVRRVHHQAWGLTLPVSGATACLAAIEPQQKRWKVWVLPQRWGGQECYWQAAVWSRWVLVSPSPGEIQVPRVSGTASVHSSPTTHPRAADWVVVVGGGADQRRGQLMGKTRPTPTTAPGYSWGDRLAQVTRGLC